MTGAAVRQARRARVTGTVVEVWDLDDPDAEVPRAEPVPLAWDEDGNLLAWEDADRWATYCCEHGEFVTHRTLRLAGLHAVDPRGWCSRCAEKAERALAGETVR